MLEEDFDCFAPAGSGENLVALAFEQHFADAKAGGLVINAEDQAVDIRLVVPVSTRLVVHELLESYSKDKNNPTERNKLPLLFWRR